MTIIAGFRCPEGVVVCADTQEVVQGISKKNVAKVKIEPAYMSIHEAITGSDLAGIFAGAGDGPFIDLLTRKAWDAAKGSTTLDDACTKIETRIKATYREYKTLFPSGHCPDVELIYGVKANKDSRLFSAHGPVVNPVDEYCSGGIGYYMADFLSSRMHNVPDLHQAVILAAYILFQAKEHVDGCGGDSHIAILRNEGKSGSVDRGRIEAFTRLLDHLDRQLGEVLIASADLRSTSSKSIEQLKRDALDVIDIFREAAVDEIKNHDALSFFTPQDAIRDDLGFSTLLSSQKSGDQP